MVTICKCICRLLTFLVKSLDEVTKESLNAHKDLANLYDLSSQYSLTEAGEDKMLELRLCVQKKKKELQDLELLFEYVKKLMDANSEVAFLVGEEFCSRQTSEKIHGAISHFQEKLEAVKFAELDLATAHKTHIEKLGKEVQVEGNE